MRTIIETLMTWLAVALFLPLPSRAADLGTEDNFFKDDKPAFEKPQPGPPKIRTTPPPAVAPPPIPPKRTQLPTMSDSEELEPVLTDEPVHIDTHAPSVPKPNTENFTADDKFIRHPFAEKGLIRIDAERSYIYKVPRSSQTRGGSMRFAFYTPTLLRNPETGVRFTDLYHAGNIPMIMVDYEWQLFHSFGKSYVTAGGGIFMASGHGEFVHEKNLTPLENFTFGVVPVSAGLAWRFQFSDRQLLVPYVVGGGTVFNFLEIRDDNQGPKFGTSPAGYGGGGVQFNMNFLETRAMLDLDREYGINAIWLTAEYRRVQSISQRFDFSANLINAGFFVEF